MKQLRTIWQGPATGGMILLASAYGVRADINTNTVPDFKEVYDLIRSHLVGESEAELNRAAVMGLLDQLHGKVSLDAVKGVTPATNQTPLTKSVLFDGPTAYLRIARVGTGLTAQITNAMEKLSATNTLKGVVLDLRFARGQDYAEATTAAELFISQGKPLLDWGNGVVGSQARTNAITLPLAILINSETSGAAEALAAILHQQAQAIIIGAASAGDAAISQEFSLKDGQTLRVATASIKLGDGQMLSAHGITPDISVAVPSEEERQYYADPYKEIAPALGGLGSLTGDDTATTNKAAKPRPINEAELMRQRKLQPGLDLEDSRLTPPATGNDSSAEKPIVRDPVLGRALDLIKGISYLRHAENH